MSDKVEKAWLALVKESIQACPNSANVEILDDEVVLRFYCAHLQSVYLYFDGRIETGGAHKLPAEVWRKWAEHQAALEEKED
jgi:hypothetical protein